MTSQSGQRILITAAKSNSFTMEIRGRCLISISMSARENRFSFISFTVLSLPYIFKLCHSILTIFALSDCPTWYGGITRRSISLRCSSLWKTVAVLVTSSMLNTGAYRSKNAISQRLINIKLYTMDLEISYWRKCVVIITYMYQYRFIRKLRTKLMFIIRAGYRSRRCSVLGLFVSLNLFAKRQ